MNLGLRWEFNGVAQSMQEFALNSIADVPGVLVFRAPEASKKNWQPRIGLAYSPGTSGKTSIRAGFGIAYDQIFDNVGTNARPPQRPLLDHRRYRATDAAGEPAAELPLEKRRYSSQHRTLLL